MKKNIYRLKGLINFYGKLVDNDMHLNKIPKFNVRKKNEIYKFLERKTSCFKRKKDQTVNKTSYMQSGNFKQRNILCVKCGEKM